MNNKALIIFIDSLLKIDTPDKSDAPSLYPRVIVNLHKINHQLGYRLFLLISWPAQTSADGLTKMITGQIDWFKKLCKGENIGFEKTINLSDRQNFDLALFDEKDAIGIDLELSWVVVKKAADLECFKNFACKTILLADDSVRQADFFAGDWDQIYHYLKSGSRTVKIHRQTRETDIQLEVNPDGSGDGQIESGIGFFDHMLDIFIKHSGCDISAQIKGDLEVDEHHTVEDTAIVLGEALRKALGDKKGIQRYGFSLPMDESKAGVLLDLAGRSNLKWKAKFKREKIGDMATELFEHFFKSFSDALQCTLHINCSGKNEHHKIESIFKAVARALRMAIRRDEQDLQIPSSKGKL